MLALPEPAQKEESSMVSAAAGCAIASAPAASSAWMVRILFWLGIPFPLMERSIGKAGGAEIL